MTPTRAAEILERIRSARIGIVGDFCLDAYWQIDTGSTELSVETGKPTHAVRSQRYNPGGAGNVAANCRAIGACSVRAFGVVGADLFGRELAALIARRGIDASGLIVQDAAWDTPVYAKPYLGSEEQERVDFGRWNVLSPEAEASLIRVVREALPELDALIVNQQLDRGFASATVVRALNEMARDARETTFILDSRTMSGTFRGMICKLNVAEACRLAGPPGADPAGLRPEVISDWARTIAGRTGMPVFVTRGADGILVFDGERDATLPAVPLTGPIDTVGAGDTTVAAIAASLAARASLCEAAEMGNLAAAVTVKKLRETGTATGEEIMGLSRLRRDA
ncbi:MAG TPA: PfkB family carbohydrate kinase [Bacteroidota bacterium]|nr:PfkB family carbohydrate kinase [Bacteroidota bacterium]